MSDLPSPPRLLRFVETLPNNLACRVTPAHNLVEIVKRVYLDTDNVGRSQLERAEANISMSKFKGALRPEQVRSPEPAYR